MVSYKEESSIWGSCACSGRKSPRGQWPLGRVVAVHPDQKGHVRSVKVQVGESVKVRPIHKLCLLEADMTADTDIEELDSTVSHTEEHVIKGQPSTVDEPELSVRPRRTRHAPVKLNDYVMN